MHCYVMIFYCFSLLHHNFGQADLKCKRCETDSLIPEHHPQVRKRRNPTAKGGFPLLGSKNRKMDTISNIKEV